MKTTSDFWSLFDKKSPIIVYGHPGTGRSTFLMSLAVHNATVNQQERSALIDCSARLTVNRLKQIAKDSAILERILVFQPNSAWNLLEIIDDIELFSKPHPQIFIDSPFWNTKPEDHRYLSYVFSKVREFFDSAASSRATFIAVNAHRASTGLVPHHRGILERYFDNRVLLKKSRRIHRAIVNLGDTEGLEVELRMTEAGLSVVDPNDVED
ncbi:MAG: hypothetical protein ACE5OZ_24370 [Candidatus Heimdallarchaeota archaeon]